MTKHHDENPHCDCDEKCRPKRLAAYRAAWFVETSIGAAGGVVAWVPHMYCFDGEKQARGHVDKYNGETGEPIYRATKYVPEST